MSGELLLLLSLSLIQPRPDGPARGAPDRVEIACADPAAPCTAAEWVMRGRTARRDRLQGISAWEAGLRERRYVGIDGVPLRRERGLFEEVRTGRVRWEREGERGVVWEAAVRSLPAVEGAGRPALERSRGPVQVRGMDASALVRDLVGRATPQVLVEDPDSDRLQLGGSWALDPLADTADAHYAHALGDTLVLDLGEGRRVRLVEVRVQPREERFDRVAASLWFDEASGALVRAAYRPPRPFDLETDAPEDAAEVPRLLRPIRLEVSLVTVDYALQEFQWWLPARWTFRGIVSIGRVLEAPVVLEWEAFDYEVNPVASTLGGLSAPLPPGWRRSVRAVGGDRNPGRRGAVTVAAPPADSLSARAWALGLGGGTARPESISPAEWSDLVAELRRIGPAAPGGLSFDLRIASLSGENGSLLRFNRVEGLSAGALATLSRGRSFRGGVEGRIGTADLRPRGELYLSGSGPDGTDWRLGVYRRLSVASGPEDRPLAPAASLRSLLFDPERTPWFEAAGGEVTLRRGTGSRVVEARLFLEHHGSVRRRTDFRVFGAGPSPPVPAAREGWAAGVEVAGRFATPPFHGGWQIFGDGAISAAPGSGGWLRGWQRIGLRSAEWGRWTMGFEGGGGFLRSREPLPQLRFPVGGDATLRGVPTGSRLGDGFRFARGEVAWGAPAFRAILFADGLSGAGDPDRIGDSATLVSAGPGLGLLDGLVRLDLARVISGGRGVLLHARVGGIL